MNISAFQSNLDFIKNIYFREEWKDEDCKKEILEALEEANEKIMNAFAVEKVVNKLPSTLSYEVRCGRLPIHTAYSAPEYVPVLAKEGLKHQVGGEDARGGLLLVDPVTGHLNTLQKVSRYKAESNETQKSTLTVLKELRKMGLLVKKEIVNQGLLYFHNHSDRENVIFDYLVDLDPDALIKPQPRNIPLIHSAMLRKTAIEDIRQLLEAGFKYHPHIGGLLFIHDGCGNTTLDRLCCNEKRADRFMEMLYDILSPTKDYPILHHIFTKSPKHKDLFIKKFPWAASLKDHNGRSLHQAILAAGPKVMNENDLLFAMLTDDQIQEKDPISTLFPFAAMAVGEHADLEKCFYLLRRHPSVMDKRSRANSSISRRRKKQKVSK